MDFIYSYSNTKLLGTCVIIILSIHSKTFLLTSFGYAAVQFSIGAIAQWAPSLIWRMSQVLCIWEGCVPYR